MYPRKREWQDGGQDNICCLMDVPGMYSLLHSRDAVSSIPYPSACFVPPCFSWKTMGLRGDVQELTLLLE